MNDVNTDYHTALLLLCNNNIIHPNKLFLWMGLLVEDMNADIYKLLFKFDFSLYEALCRDAQLYFQHHYCSLQCHMIFRNHNNILIYFLRNISDYYQCWKNSPMIWWYEVQKNSISLKQKSNIIHDPALTFDQFNASVLHSFKENPQTFDQRCSWSVQMQSAGLQTH